MKPATFDYLTPQTLVEAAVMLRAAGPEAKLLAGGQTLVPAMNMRVARPTALVDLNAIDELSFIRDLGDGLEIGAMTRQRSIERSSVVAERCPLLAAAMPHIAHFQIRNRGTLGGSLAHNDPAAELPAVIAALDGTLTLASAQGRRDVDWRDFFCGLLSTALATDENSHLGTDVRTSARNGRELRRGQSPPRGFCTRWHRRRAALREGRNDRSCAPRIVWGRRRAGSLK